MQQVPTASNTLDDYLRLRGRSCELSFSPSQVQTSPVDKMPSMVNGIQRHMIICENEPAELPEDVVRCNTKVDDGIEHLNLNLSSILKKFEQGNISNGDEGSHASPAGVVIEKPTINIKKTLMAFESRLVETNGVENGHSDKTNERPVVRKLSHGFISRQNSQDTDSNSTPVKPVAVTRSGSLLMRLKKFESRIAGEQVKDDDSSEDENNNDKVPDLKSKSDQTQLDRSAEFKLASVNLSSLKSQWESGDIVRRRDDDEDEKKASDVGDSTVNGNSPSIEKNEELNSIREQLARKKSGSIRNIYENAIKQAQNQTTMRDSSDLSALNGVSTNGIQRQLLKSSHNGGGGSNIETTVTPTKEHFQLNLSNKANKLKEKFELGLIDNSSHDDSDLSDSNEPPAMTKLEQIRQEKLQDLSVFTEGEIQAREARNLFQQIDRRLSAASVNRQPPVASARSLSSISASMSNKLTSQMSANSAKNHNQHPPLEPQHQQQKQPSQEQLQEQPQELPQEQPQEQIQQSEEQIDKSQQQPDQPQQQLQNPLTQIQQQIQQPEQQLSQPQMQQQPPQKQILHQPQPKLQQHQPRQPQIQPKLRQQHQSQQQRQKQLLQQQQQLHQQQQQQQAELQPIRLYNNVRN